MPISGSLSSLGGHFDPIAESARRATEQVRELSGEVQRISTQVRSNSQNIQSVIETLNNSMSGIVSEIRGVTTSIQGLSAASRQGRGDIEQNAKTMEDAYKVYREMGLEVRKLGLDLENLKFTESELNKVVKIGTDYTTQGNAKRASSYDALSQRYRAMKILYDNMTESERQNNTEFVAGLRDLYEKMNLLQQATGKYQLQVGNYSKAMTGLNIATQQVLRELPTLANSATTFAIAISNNIPILIDNIQAVRKANAATIAYKNGLLEQAVAAEAAGDAMLAMKLKNEAAGVATTTVLQGLISSIFSWQTLIVGLLTILPMFLRKMEQKKKAMKEDAEATKEDAKAHKELAKYADDWFTIMKEINMEVAKQTAEVKTMVSIINDENFAQEKRIAAAERLKQVWDDQLANYSAEEILSGKAKTAIDALTDSLIAQAIARGKLDKITDYSQQIADLQESLALVGEWTTGLKGAPTIADLVGKIDADPTIRISASLQDLVSRYREINGQIASFENRITRLRDTLDPEDLLEGGRGRGRGGKPIKEQTLSITDYFYEMWQSRIDIMEEGVEKELEILALDYNRQREEREKLIADMQAIQATGDEQAREEAIWQEAFLRQIGLNAEVKYAQDRLRVRQEFFERVNKENEDAINEGLKAVEDAQKEQLNELKQYYDTEKDLTFAQYDNKQNRTRAMLKIEIDYLKARKELLKQQGKLTLAMDNEIEAEIEKLGQQIDDLTPRGFLDWLSQEVDENWSHRFTTNIERAFSTAGKYAEEWMDKRIEMAEKIVEAIEKEVNATKEALDLEQQARVNGYANNVELARREYEEKLALERKAIAEEQRLQRVQEQIDSAVQLSSLITAASNIWKSNSGKPFGTALAIAAIATMFGSFAAAKIQASQLTAKTYGEGGYEYMNYGGSHASGHDIDFGRTRDGRPRRVERGEMVGIINKKNVAKYGVGTIGGIIDSLNNGTFEYADKYSLAFQGSNLSTLESGVNALVEQGKEKIVATPWGRIEYSGNVKRIIKN